MIFLTHKIQSPRTYDIVILQDKSGDFIYVSRDIYDKALILENKAKGNPREIEEQLLKDSRVKVDPALVNCLVELYPDTPRPINCILPYVLIAEDVRLPEISDPFELKGWVYNLLDLVCTSIDVVTYMTLQASLRSPMVNQSHLAANYKDRIRHTQAIWFTGVEYIPIDNVEVIEQPVYVQTVQKEAVNVATPAEPVGQPKQVENALADLKTDSASNPPANSISEEEYEALMAELAAMDEELESELKDNKKKEETPVQQEATKTSGNTEQDQIQNLFGKILADL